MNPSRLTHDNNFGALRYLMALAVIAAHFSVQTGAFQSLSHWLGIGSYVAVTGFFILSGFLVYQSRERSENSLAFLRKRFTRIFPSYLTVVVACAIGLVIVSELSPGDYFSHPHWRRYLGANVFTLNFLQPTLPGVFGTHPEPSVNGSLWTIKVELFLYATLIPVFLIMRRFKLNPLLILGIMIVLSLGYVEGMSSLEDKYAIGFLTSMKQQFLAQLGFFYAGMVCYLYLDKIKRYRWFLLGGCGLATLAVLALMFDTAAGRYIVLPVSLAGFITSAAFTGKWGFLLNRFENCSFEMYLWHMPVIHLSRHYGLFERVNSIGGLAIVIAITAVAAYLTAHCISTPLRRKLSRK